MIGCSVLLGSILGSFYTVLILSSRSTKQETIDWAISFFVCAGLDFVFNEFFKILTTIAFMKMLKQVSGRCTLRVIRALIDPVVTRALYFTVISKTSREPLDETVSTMEPHLPVKITNDYSTVVNGLKSPKGVSTKDLTSQNDKERLD